MHIRINAGSPAPAQHLTDHDAFALDITCLQALYTWNQAGILDHVRHKVGWITPNWVEFQSRGPDETFKYIMHS
jgi:hypothetical protein